MKKLFLLFTVIAGFCALGPVAQARDYHHRSREVYIIEHDRPVYRRAYFDDYDRCYVYRGPRRVYVREYYTSYPRYYRPHVYRPGVSFSFGFGR